MARASLLDTPAPRWSTDIEVMPDTSPVFGFGAVIYAGSDGHYAAVDFHTGDPLWKITAGPQGGLQTPVLCGGALYLATDGGALYAASPITGALLWSGPVSFGASALTSPLPGLGYVPATGQQEQVIYLMDAGKLYLLPTSTVGGDPPKPRTVYSAAGSLSFETGLAYDRSSGNMIINTSRGLIALAAKLASSETWDLVWERDLGDPVTPITLGMGKSFVGTPAQTMAIVDNTTGNSLESALLRSGIEQPVLVDAPHNVAFVPTDNGTIFQLDATSAKHVADFQPGGPVTTPLVQEDGLAYYGSGDRSVYAFDLSHPGQVVSAPAAEPVTYLAGISSGTAYFGTQAHLHAVALANLIHDFNSQSQLMVDFAGAQHQTSFAQVPAYQSHVVLYDPQGNVRTGESVKVWASAPVTLITDNQSFDIGPDQAAAFQSNGTGHIVLSVQANTSVTAAAPSGLSTPALTLWASFMAPEERILIYPDERLHAALQSITGAQLQAAVTYGEDPSQPGPLLLPAGFQGPHGLSNANALARAINNAVVLVPPKKPAATEVSSTYLAYPETMIGVSYSPTLPDTTRHAAPGAVPNWSLTLSGASGATFTPHASAAEAARAADAAHDARIRSGSPPGNIFDDFEHFVDNVIHGAEKIVQTVWQVAEHAITAAVHTLENEYNLVVTTIEEAAHVVLGFLKSVVADVENAIEKIIEALGFLFDWKSILLTHEHVKAVINDGFTNVRVAISRFESECDAFFDMLAQAIVDNFRGVIGKLAGQGALGDVVGSTDPNQAFTTNGTENHSVPGTWLFHRVMTSAVGTNGRVTVGDVPIAAAGGALGNPVDVVAAAMLVFLENVGEDVAKVALNLSDLVLAAIDELTAALLEPAGARRAKLADLLLALETLLSDLVQLAKDASDDFCKLLTAVVEAVQQMLNARIDMPFVSWLYTLITHEQLSLLDLFALIVAVPVTVMYKAITGEAPFQSTHVEARSGTGAELISPKATLNVQNMIWTFNAMIYAFLDCISNAMGDASPPLLEYGQGLNNAISQGLTVPFSGTETQIRDWTLLWIYQGFPTVWTVHCAMETGTGRKTSTTVLPAWGIGGAIWQAVYAGIYPDQFFDDGVKLVQNEVGCLSTISGFAKQSDNPDVLAVVLVADFFLDMANALIEIKYWRTNAQ